jgi:hypothetical protein
MSAPLLVHLLFPPEELHLEDQHPVRCSDRYCIRH